MPSGAVVIIAILGIVGAAVLIDLSVRRSRALWYAAFTGTPAPALLLDRSGRVQAANPAFRRWGGLAESSDVSSLLRNSYATDGTSADGDTPLPLLQAAAARRPWHGELRIRISGTPFSADAWLLPVPYGSSSILHFEASKAGSVLPDASFPTGMFQEIVDDSTGGILVVKEDRIVYANPAAARMFGCEHAADLLTATISEIISPSSRALFAHPSIDRPVGAQILAHSEIRGLTRHGRVVDLEVSARVIPWGSDRALEVFVRDITDRKTLEREQALWHWEQEALSEIDRNIVGVADLNTILDSILQHAVSLVRADWSAVMTMDPGGHQALWRMIRGGRTAQQAEFAVEEDLRQFLVSADEQIVREDVTGKPAAVGQLMDQEQLRTTVWTPLKVAGEVVGALVVGHRSQRDPQRREFRLLASLAEKTAIAMLNARRYERVLERERELEKLSISRVEAQEEERRRIAKEIHDGIGQMLTAIKFNLEILEDSIPEGSEGAARVTDMKGVLDNLMKEAREMSYALMPSVLEDFGLAPALQMLSEQFSAKHDIRTVFQNHGLTRRLRRMLEISLYRIAQDALANVARHAAASEVTVQVIRSSDRIRLVIEDNGKGVAASGAQSSGLGFVSMRERASQFGGTLTVDSSPGEGTIISVEIPLVDEDRS